MNELEKLRSEIDEIDKDLIGLFEKRMERAYKIAEYKKKNNLEIFNEERELEVIKKNVARLKNKNIQKETKSFINKVMEISRDIQKKYLSGDDSLSDEYMKKSNSLAESKAPLRIGYQGEPGSFSEEALIEYFGDELNTYNVRDFEDVFKALKDNKIDYGVLPIENSSTGGISDVYDLLRKYGFYIVGERCIKVEHNLVSVKGSKLEDIKEVYSHTQAFQQSSEFFQNYPNLKLIPFKNTAISAKYINEENDINKGAVCSKKAAKLYNLEILKENINNNRSNYTRFIIIGRDLKVDDSLNKISIVTTTAHIPGALYKVLSIFAENNLNIMKIESRPIKDRSWEYFFYIDFSGNLNDEIVKKSIKLIKENSSYFKLLGNYKGHKI